MLTVQATAAQVEAMFGCTLAWYEQVVDDTETADTHDDSTHDSTADAAHTTTAHTASAHTASAASSRARRPLLRATTGVTLPAHLVEHTRLLLGLVDPPMSTRVQAVEPRRSVQSRPIKAGWPRTAPGNRAQPSDVGSAAASYTPFSCAALYADPSSPPVRPMQFVSSDFVQARYNISSRAAATGFDGSRVAIIGGYQDPTGDLANVPERACYDSADLANIGAAYGYQQPPIAVDAPWARANDLIFQQQQAADFENTLDSQAVYLVAPTAAMSLLASGDFVSFLETFQQLLRMPPSQRPHILSMSFAQASDAADYLGAGVADAIDSALMQLGLVGVTVIVASGDNGAVGSNVECTVPPPAELGVATGQFVKSYPSSSPFALSVGATDLSFGLGATAAESAPFFRAQFDGVSSTPRFCGPCADHPASSIVCQSAYIAEQAVSVNLTAGHSNAGYALLARH